MKEPDPIGGCSICGFLAFVAPIINAQGWKVGQICEDCEESRRLPAARPSQRARAGVSILKPRRLKRG